MTAYDAAAQAWADGPAAVYARFAATMLEHSPAPLSGAAVLDVGAGTAVASDAALAAGAAPGGRHGRRGADAAPAHSVDTGRAG